MARLIIAEDSAHMLRLLEMTLRKGGHTWTSCNDGTEVLAAAAKEVPELFILDVIMPIMDGLAALFLAKPFSPTELLAAIDSLTTPKP